MTLGDAVGLSDSQERHITRGLQLLLGGVLVAGVVTAQVGMVVTGSIALGATLIPALLRREYGYSMDPGLVLWITIAMILHTIGSLGFYEQYQWYDEITHTASATIIAGIGYASFRALERHYRAIDVPSEFRAVFIVVFVLATGVFWEVIEYALGGYVTVYGIDDIVTDFVFNAVGAVIVAVWGAGYVRNLAGFFNDRLRAS